MKGSRGAGWGAALRKTLGRKGGTVGRRNERRDEPMRKRWRLQIDREVFGRGAAKTRGPRLRSRSSLCQPNSDSFPLAYRRWKSPSERGVERELVLVCYLERVRTTDKCMALDGRVDDTPHTRSRVSGAGRDFAAAGMRVRWDQARLYSTSERKRVCARLE